MKKPKILCVDDEKDVLDSLVRLLRRDFAVLTALSAESGLDILNQHPDISIVLTDYHLPGISGGDFLHLVKSKVPSAVRALLSGQIDLQQMSELLNRADVHRFILKPWTNEYLLIQMKEALFSHNVLQERERLQVLAITDPLTGLTNHRYFQELLKREWTIAQQTQKPLSLLMIDLDNFKMCNDLYGHLVGDQFLAEAANRMNQIRQPGESLSRYGGEEFGLIMPSTNAEKAHQRAELIRQIIADSPFQASPDLQNPSRLATNHTLNNTSNDSSQTPNHTLTVSIGVATQSSHSHFASPLSFVAAADGALFESKHRGRNRIYTAHPTHDRK